MEPQLIPPVRAVLREFSRAGCSGRVLLDIEGDPDATYEKVVVEFSAAMPPVEAMAMSDRAEDRLNEEFPTLAHRIIPIVFSR